MFDRLGVNMWLFDWNYLQLIDWWRETGVLNSTMGNDLESKTHFSFFLKTRCDQHWEDWRALPSYLWCKGTFHCPSHHRWGGQGKKQELQKKKKNPAFILLDLQSDTTILKHQESREEDDKQQAVKSFFCDVFRFINHCFNNVKRMGTNKWQKVINV